MLLKMPLHAYLLFWYWKTFKNLLPNLIHLKKYCYYGETIKS